MNFHFMTIIKLDCNLGYYCTFYLHMHLFDSYSHQLFYILNVINL